MSTTKKKAPPKTQWLTRKGSGCGNCYGNNDVCKLCADRLHRLFEVPRHEAVRICAAVRKSRYTVIVTNVDTDLTIATVDGRRLGFFDPLGRQRHLVCVCFWR